MEPLAARCHPGLGTLDAEFSDVESMRAHLDMAPRMYGAMGMRFWLQKLEVEAAT